MDQKPNTSRRQPLSIQASLGLAVAITVASTVLGLVALFGYRMNLLGSRYSEVRALTLADAYAAQLHPVLQAGGGQKEIAAFVDRLSLPTDVRFLAVLDADNRPLTIWGPRTVFEQSFDLVGNHLDRPRTSLVTLEETSESTVLNLAAVPVASSDRQGNAGTLLLAIRSISSDAFATERALPFLVGIAAVATVGFALGFLYLHYSVIRPLTLLRRRSRQLSRPSQDEPLPGHLPDELAVLARTLANLQMDLDQWRQRNDRLQHDFATRIQTETARLTRELRHTQHKAWTDPLTGLGNRRLLDDKLDDIFQARQRSAENLAVVMLDVDHFKKLNDTLGHSAGDDLLRFIGDLLRQCVREQDLAVRYGGDEFLLILPGVSATQARNIVDRAVRLFAQQTRLIDVQPRPGMSAGVAAILEHHPNSPEQLLQMADAALYQAKKTDKVRVAIFDRATTNLK